jgi:hypothetical protein
MLPLCHVCLSSLLDQVVIPTFAIPRACKQCGAKDSHGTMSFDEWKERVELNAKRAIN